MKRTRSKDEQIIGIPAKHEAGAKCADLYRKLGMSEGTFYIYGRPTSALLHKSANSQSSPFPGHTYPAATVTGMPRAVKRFMTAARI